MVQKGVDKGAVPLILGIQNGIARPAQKALGILKGQLHGQKKGDHLVPGRLFLPGKDLIGLGAVQTGAPDTLAFGYGPVRQGLVKKLRQFLGA